MPIHDWTRVEPGDFHHFHQRWISALADALNGGLLPDEYMAMAEQVTGRPVPDVVTLQTRRMPGPAGGLAVADAPPTAAVVVKPDRVNYAARANRVAIRHGRSKVVAVIEIVSPGNKGSRNALRVFVEKAADLLNQGVNLLVVDLFPPTPRDPQGVLKAILDEFADERFALPPGKPLTAGAFVAGDLPTIYIEPLAVGDRLPAMPLFLSEDRYVPCPLAETYEQSWAVYPKLLRQVVDPAAG